MPFEMRALAFSMAIALQVQTTLPIGEAGIRVALSDLFLPICAMYTAVRLSKAPTRFRWHTPGVVWWLIAITAALTLSLIMGHERLGRWSSWALVNKYLGWYALVAYFMVGTAVVRFGGLEMREEFLRTFLFVSAAIAGANLIALPWLLTQYTLLFGIEFNRATGAMQNSNAFAFLLAVSALLVIARGERLKLLLPPLIAALWFTASRGGLLAFIIGAASYLFLSRRLLPPALKPAGIAVLVIVAVSIGSIAADPNRLAEILSGHSPLGLLSAERLDLDAATIAKREAQNARAVHLFASAPVFGHGLGYFIEKTGTSLHNSLLWLLLETGLVGTAVFTGFLATAVRCLYLGRSDPILLGMVAASLAFVVMSVSGEFLYQRHLWLLLGMALAVIPAVKKPA